LDLPTLSVLENFLLEFQGCLLIVSHERYFMDRLVDHLFVFEGDGEIRDFPGNYSQYREGQKESEDDVNQEEKKAEPAKSLVSPSQKKKLSYKEQREFESLERELADLEQEKREISEKLAATGVDFEELRKLSQRVGEVSALLDQKELRWLELSELKS